MKKIGIYFVAFTVAAATAFTSCKKDDENPSNNNPASKQCYVTKVKEDGKLSTEITYNSSDKVDKMKIYDSTGTMVESEYQATYDAQGRLSKLEEVPASGQSEFYATFEYNSDNTLSKTHYYTRDSSDQMTEVMYYTHEYDANKRMTRSRQYFKYMGQVFQLGYEDYSYDSKNNISKITVYTVDFMTQQATMSSTKDYSYDDKKNPMGIFGPLTFFGMASTISPNNVVTEVEKDNNGATTRSVTNSYTYTSENYPSKATRTEDSYTSTSDYEYNCK